MKTLLNFSKQSTQLRGKEEQRERTQVRAEEMQKPKGAQGGCREAKEQIRFQSLHQLQETSPKRKGKRNLKAQ